MASGCTVSSCARGWLFNSYRDAVWQLERGKNGTAHLQGYVEFGKPMSLAAIKKVLERTAYVEERRGTRDEACLGRVEGQWEYGVWISGAGHRTDIETVLEALKQGRTEEGKTEEEILDAHPVEWARHCKIIERYRMTKAPKRSLKTVETRGRGKWVRCKSWRRMGTGRVRVDGMTDTMASKI